MRLIHECLRYIVPVPVASSTFEIIAVVPPPIIMYSSTCTSNLMLMYFDALTPPKRDYSGKMGFNEFKELWGALNQWKVS